MQKGSTPLFFDWSKNGQKLDSKTKSNYKIETFADISILTIDRVSRTDTAKYLCNVRNGFGTDSQTVVLSVSGDPITLID